MFADVTNEETRRNLNKIISAGTTESHLIEVMTLEGVNIDELFEVEEFINYVAEIMDRTKF